MAKVTALNFNNVEELPELPDNAEIVIKLGSSSRTAKVVAGLAKEMPNISKIEHIRSMQHVIYKTVFYFGWFVVIVEGALGSGSTNEGSHTFRSLLIDAFNVAETDADQITKSGHDIASITVEF